MMLMRKLYSGKCGNMTFEEVKRSARDAASGRLIQLTCFHSVASMTCQQPQPMQHLVSRRQLALSSRRRTTDKNNDSVASTSHTLLAESTGTCCGWPRCSLSYVRLRKCPTYRSPDSPVHRPRQMTADNRPLAFRRRHRQNKHICDFELSGGR